MSIEAKPVSKQHIISLSTLLYSNNTHVCRPRCSLTAVNTHCVRIILGTYYKLIYTSLDTLEYPHCFHIVLVILT